MSAWPCLAAFMSVLSSHGQPRSCRDWTRSSSPLPAAVAHSCKHLTCVMCCSVAGSPLLSCQGQP
eukprot:6058-Heterococcus_DN1.PRE.1